MKKIGIIAIVATLVSATSCLEEPGFIAPVADGPTIQFGLSTYNSLSSVKTEYSGEIVGGYERINWRVGEDVIRITSNIGVTKDGSLTADYKVAANDSTNVAGRRISEAEAAPEIAGNDLYWNVSNTDHYFFGLYPKPANATDFINNSQTDGVTRDSALIKGTIPSLQVPLTTLAVTEWDGGDPTKKRYTREYLPDMTDAYMYASARVAGKGVGSTKVPLAFKPLFSAFKFYVTAGDSMTRTCYIDTVRLYTTRAGAALSGDFEAMVGVATNNRTGDIGRLDTLNTDNGVRMILTPAMTDTLGRDTVVFTLLALPTDHTNLVLDVAFHDKNGDKHRRSLFLHNKTTDAWYTLPATRKLYVNMSLVDIEYILQVTQREDGNTFAVGGEEKLSYYSVNSYRQLYKENDAGKMVLTAEKWPWKAVEYYYDAGTTAAWHTTPPAWVKFVADETGYLHNAGHEGFVPTDWTKENPSEAGKLDKGIPFNAKMTIASADARWKKIAELGNDTPANAINLANHDIFGNTYPGPDKNSEWPYETANCYVVMGPGWYKIPAVIGNAYKDGRLNPSAYVSPAVGSYILTGSFPAHNPNGDYLLGNNVGPWITRSKGGTDGNGNGPAGYGLPWFRHASVIWEDNENLIYVPHHDDPDYPQIVDKVGGEAGNYAEFDAHYIYFKVSEDLLDDNTFPGGNAVIGCFNNDGYKQVGWSWHIWVVPKNRLRTHVVYYWKDPQIGEPVPGVENMKTLGANEMLNMNLGYVSGIPSRYCIVKLQQENSGKVGYVDLVQNGDAHNTSAVHYQWGRKDPMFPIAGDPSAMGKDIYFYVKNTSLGTPPLTISSTSQPYVGFYQTWRDRESHPQNQLSQNPISETVQRPWEFRATINPTGCWSGRRYDNLWDMSVLYYLESEEHYDHEVVKTIYDPSPPGYNVPNEYAFTGFNKIGVDYQYTQDMKDSGIKATDVINGLESSFGIGPILNFDSQGMYLYVNPLHKDDGVIFFPACGRRRGFDSGDGPGSIQNLYTESMYWTASPYQALENSAYARTFTMRRVEDGSTTHTIPQCFPVYTAYAAPLIGSDPQYSGFLRAHGFQVRAVRHIADPYFNFDPGYVSPGSTTFSPLYITVP